VPRQAINFNGPAYTDVSRFLSGQECVNYFLRPFPDDEKGGTGFALVGSPGLEELVDLGTSAPIRGMFPTTNVLYAVSGLSFFRIDEIGTPTEIGAGTITEDVNLVSLATNGVDITFVDGTAGYVYNIATDTLTQITSLDFPNGTKIGFIAGFYFVSPPGTQEIHQSAFNDGLTWEGYFDSAGQEADRIVDLLVDHTDLIVIGSQSIEPWFNAGLGGFALSRRTFIEQGSPALWSSAKANNAVYFLGQDKNGAGAVFQLLGLQPSQVSTPAIEYQISQLTKLDDAIGFTYEQNGQTFYALTFPTDDRTFIYDTGNAQWHERSSVLTTDGVTRNGRWRVNNHVFWRGNNIVGDFENGKIYKLKSDAYDEDGTDIIRTRTTAIIRKNQNSISINELQILHEPGVGLSTGNAADVSPHDILSWSGDGGFTWGNEIHVPIGKLGEYANRAITPPLGQGRNWVLKLKNSTKTQQVIVGAHADIEIDRD